MNRLSTWPLVQSNALSMASYQLSLHELRLYYLCLLQVIPFHQGHSGFFKIMRKGYSAVYGINASQAAKDVKAAVASWQEKQVILPKYQGPWLQGSYARWPQGYAIIQMRSEIMQEITRQKRGFTRLYFQDLVGLNRVFALRLYHSLAQFQHTGFLTLSVEALRKRYQLGRSYAQWSALRTRLLEPALALINTRTHMTVYYVPDVKNGKTVRLSFFMQRPVHSLHRACNPLRQPS